MSTLSTAANNLYELYVRANKELAQSMVFKFAEIANGVNESVRQKTGAEVDLANPASWKYYQNICGQYHSTDTAMTVYSLDSETTISFTVSALNANPVTRAAYAFGSTYYNDLLASYPDQEMLILGILYPADMSTALAAPDGTILAYPTHLVEPREVDLIVNLQSWINAYVNRWIVRSFSITDNLYPAVFLAQLTLNVMGQLLNLRLQACKTNQVHSFLMRQYLRSHGFLDVFLDQMSDKQALDMYRNIKYYFRNAGFASTFDRLIDVVFTEANLPAYQYEMRHNQESLSHAHPGDVHYLQSQPGFKRLPLNDKARQYPLPDYSLEQVHAATASQTPYNGDYQDQNFGAIHQALSLSPKGQLGTKVIEVATNPVTRPSQLAPDDILYTQWIDWVASSRYAVPVEFIPEGAKSPVRLDHQQAAAMWIYAVHRATEPLQIPNYPKLLRVPPIQLSQVVRTPKPDIDELYAVVGSPHLSDEIVQAIHDSAVVVPDTIDSLNHFQEVCGEIFVAATTQYNLYSFQHHPQARGHAMGAALRLYADKVVVLDNLLDEDDPTQGMLYTTLIQQLGLNFSGYRPVDYFNMSVRILAAATGADLNDLLDPVNVQRAMVSLMRYLSSYSVQFVSSGSSMLVTIVPRPDVRVSDYQAEEGAVHYADLKYSRPLGETATEMFTVDLRLPSIPSGEVLQATNTFVNDIDVKLVPDNAYVFNEAPYMTSRTGISLDYSNTLEEGFLALTMEERMTIPDVYGYPG